MLKDLPAVREDLGSIPGSGRSPGEGKATHSMGRTEEPGGLQFMGSQRVRHSSSTNTL